MATHAILRPATTLHTPEKAETIAAANNATDADGWRYEARTASDGWARILVFDEDGIFVDYL